MIPWIQVYSNLPQHPKTSRLADELGLSCVSLNPNALAVGLLVCLWTWAVQNACDGDLSGCSVRAIAEACRWKKKPEVLIQALKKSGYLDADMRLHDWEEYASLLMEQEENRKAKTRDRVKRYRERKSADCNVTSNAYCNVTETLSNASVTQNVTPPLFPPFSPPSDSPPIIPPSPPLNQTIQNQTEQNQTVLLCGGGGVYVGAHEKSDIGGFLEPMAETKSTVNELFESFSVRQPTKADIENVREVVEVRRQGQDGGWYSSFSQDRKELLAYAFQAANDVGKPGDWTYIRGVLGKLKQRNISTLDEAEEYDWARLS